MTASDNFLITLTTSYDKCPFLSCTPLMWYPSDLIFILYLTSPSFMYDSVEIVNIMLYYTNWIENKQWGVAWGNYSFKRWGAFWVFLVSKTGRERELGICEKVPLEHRMYVCFINGVYATPLIWDPFDLISFILFYFILISFISYILFCDSEYRDGSLLRNSILMSILQVHWFLGLRFKV